MQNCFAQCCFLQNIINKDQRTFFMYLIFSDYQSIILCCMIFEDLELQQNVLLSFLSREVENYGLKGI